LKDVIGIRKLDDFYLKETEENKLIILEKCVRTRYPTDHIHSLLERSNSSSELLEKCFELAINSGFKADTITFLIMIEELVLLKEIEKAIRYFHKMDEKRFNVKRSIEHYERLFFIFKRNMDIDNIEKYYNLMKKEEIIPSKSAILSIMCVYQSIGNFDKIKQIYEEMELDSRPDVIILNKMLQVYSDYGDLSNVLRYFGYFASYSLIPTTRTYNIIMNTYLKMGDSISIEYYYRKLIQSNLFPNNETFRILILSITLSKDSSKIDYIMKEIKKFDIKINDSCYYHLSIALESLGEQGKQQSEEYLQIFKSTKSYKRYKKITEKRFNLFQLGNYSNEEMDEIITKKYSKPEEPLPST